MSLLLYELTSTLKRLIDKSDTAINHVRIDSIQLVITERESIVYKLKEHEKDIEDKVISLNDSATWELFKKLVSE